MAAWAWQIWVGMGVAGIRTPQMWALYITNFVFWIGIGHAGTLISAILYLFRAKWRTSIYRGAEAMTVFAVLTAGPVPARSTSGRMWFAYWLLPYPNQRYLWPNFKSPLIWDVFAISTYLTISVVFFIVGLVPDIAAMRDHSTGLKRKIYAVLRARLGGLATRSGATTGAATVCSPRWPPRSCSPCTAWCRSTSRWPWCPAGTRACSRPFFVDGAIFSGFAMVLILILPMRYLFDWYAYITDRHLDAMAKLTLVTSLVLTYFYLCEAGTAWYSGEHYERASLFARAFKSYKYTFWLQYICNSLIPLVLFWRKARTNPVILYVVSIFVLIGMWLERFNIIVPGLGYDFYPYTWGIYLPTADGQHHHGRRPSPGSSSCSWASSG